MSNNNSTSPELGRIVRGTSFNIIGAIFRSLFGFLFVFIMAKITTTDEMGLLFLGISIITFMTIIAIGGLDAGIRRFVSIAHGYDDDKLAWDYFLSAISISIPIVLLMSGGLFIFSGTISTHIFSKPELDIVIKSLLPFLLFYTLSELLLSATQAYKHMKYWVICLDILNTGLRILLALLLSLVGMTLYAGILGYVLSIIIATMLALYYFRNVMPKRRIHITEYKRRDLLVFSLPVAFARLTNSGNGLLESLIVGYYLVASEVGIFTVAIKVVAIGTIVLASFNTMFAPIISQLHHKGKMSELKQLFACVTRWIFSISLPMFMLMAWYAISISNLFGDEYIAGASCIVVLCLGQLVNAITGPSGNLLLMSGHTFINLWTNITGLFLSVVLNILLIPPFGILGSAMAVGIAITVINISRVILAWKILHIHPYEWGYWKPITAALIVLLALVVLGPPRDEILDAIKLALISIVALLAYLFILISLGLNETDRYVLNKLRERLNMGPGQRR